MYKQRYKTPDLCDDIILLSDGEYLTGLYFENSKEALKKLTVLRISVCRCSRLR